MKTKIAYGAKDNISNAISEGTIDSGDIVFTSDTNEAAFITSDGVPNFVKSRSTKSYTLNGTTLGALANGDTIPTDIDMDGLLNLITQKAIAPTYSNPTISIVNSSGTASGTYETGTEITPKVKATFTQNDAGVLTTIKVFKNDTVEVGSDTTSPYTYNGEAFILGDETVKYEARASYEAGNPKANNLGVYDETGLAAGTVESSEYKFTGQRNLFYGTGVGSTPELTSAIVRALTNKKLNPTQNYSFNITVDIGQQYILFAYPATLRDVNQVMYVETNDTGMAESFTKTLVDIADARGTNEDGSLNGPMSYKVYSYAMAAPAAAKMTFKVTI
jgi:hypothetical protein